jgi:nucleoid-associated protein YgaU
VGRGDDWQGIALANNIENPRLLEPGQLIDLNVTTPTAATVNFTPPSVNITFGRS